MSTARRFAGARFGEPAGRGPARRLGAGRIAVAEDAVQHALMQALSLWPFKGVPDRPEAWLAPPRNRALDLLRSKSRSLALAEELVPLSPAPAPRRARDAISTAS